MVHNLDGGGPWPAVRTETRNWRRRFENRQFVQLNAYDLLNEPSGEPLLSPRSTLPVGRS